MPALAVDVPVPPAALVATQKPVKIINAWSIEQPAAAPAIAWTGKSSLGTWPVKTVAEASKPKKKLHKYVTWDTSSGTPTPVFVSVLQ